MALLGLIHPSEDPIDAGNLRLFLGEGQGRVMLVTLGGQDVCNNSCPPALCTKLGMKIRPCNKNV